MNVQDFEGFSNFIVAINARMIELEREISRLKNPKTQQIEEVVK